MCSGGNSPTVGEGIDLLDPVRHHQSGGLAAGDLAIRRAVVPATRIGFDSFQLLDRRMVSTSRRAASAASSR